MNVVWKGHEVTSSVSGTVLVLRSGALGDFVLTLPVLETLRASLRGARLVYAGRNEFGRLALRGGLVDEVLSEDRPEVVSLFSRSPDAADGLQGLLGPIGLAVSFISSDVLTRNLLAAGAAEVVTCSARPPPADGVPTHAADHLLSALRGRVDVRGPALPRLPVSEDARKRARRALAERGVAVSVDGKAPGRMLAIHPGSGSPGKNWPAERFADLARAAREEHGMSVLLLLGPAELGCRGTQNLSSATGHGQNTVDGEDKYCVPRQREALVSVADAVLESPRLTLLAGVLAEASAYVGNDSGVTHLAAACGAPVVAIFGPTDPAVWGPRGENVRVVRDPSGALEGVEVGQVLQALSALLAGTQDA